MEPEPKLFRDAETPKGAVRVEFSFNKYFNAQKHIGKPVVPFEYQLNEEDTKKLIMFQDWLLKNGVSHKKVAYPAFFEARPGIHYPGLIALEDIGENEVPLCKESQILH